jgi:hypothetical protein
MQNYDNGMSGVLMTLALLCALLTGLLGFILGSGILF